MNSSKKERKTTVYNLLLIVFLSAFTSNLHLIQSQTITNTNEPEWFDEERLIKYRTLNEIKKLEEYKFQSEKRDSIRLVEISKKDSTISSQQNLIDRYEKNIIPKLQLKASLYDELKSKNDEIYAVREEKWEIKYQSLKSKRLGLGFYAGYGATITNLQPSIGLSINYTLIRF